MKLHTRNGGSEVDFADSELADRPTEPLSTAETALITIIVAVLCFAGGVFLYAAARYALPQIWR